MGRLGDWEMGGLGDGEMKMGRWGDGEMEMIRDNARIEGPKGLLYSRIYKHINPLKILRPEL